MNRVELQNGCLALGHANLFIPSTLDGSNIDLGTGKVDKDKFTKNMMLATEVYINRVNHCPCGETTIELFPGTNSEEKQKLRESLIIFLKGSQADRSRLKSDSSELYDYFNKVWNLRDRHLRKDVPSQYLFSLVCCLQEGCCHPICMAHVNGNVSDLCRWFEGGPSIKYLPIPIPDPARPWDSSDCPECSGQCTGHFLKPADAVDSSLPVMLQPPSAVIKEEFGKLKGTPTTTFLEDLAKKVLLSQSEVSMWLEHLQTVSDNRKRGAAKAAETRKKRKAQKRSQEQHQLYFCGVCQDPYMDVTDNAEMWIGCELCDRWFHFVCLGIVTEPERYVCVNCQP